MEYRYARQMTPLGVWITRSTYGWLRRATDVMRSVTPVRGFAARFRA